MYALVKNKEEVRYAENVSSIKLKNNGTYAVCGEEERNGVCADGKIYLNDYFDDIKYLNAPTLVERLSSISREYIYFESIRANTPPPVNTGLARFGLQQWEVNKEYNKYQMFIYNGHVGYVKEAHTSQEDLVPFTPETESLYGARPVPNESDVYPYVYTMATEEEMKVYDPITNKTYRCIKPTGNLLLSPHEDAESFQELT